MAKSKLEGGNKGKKRRVMRRPDDTRSMIVQKAINKNERKKGMVYWKSRLIVLRQMRK